MMEGRTEFNTDTKNPRMKFIWPFAGSVTICCNIIIAPYLSLKMTFNFKAYYAPRLAEQREAGQDT